MNVLVVEDDEAVRRLIIEALRGRGCLNVDGARDGRDALHLISTKRYAVIVLDVMMPYMSGIDFLDSLQALLCDPSLKSIDQTPAVIVVTGCTNEMLPKGVIQQRFPTMVHDVMRKPVDIAKLTSRVERLM